jgi:hypothetical protein
VDVPSADEGLDIRFLVSCTDIDRIRCSISHTFEFSPRPVFTHIMHVRILHFLLRIVHYRAITALFHVPHATMITSVDVVRYCIT